MRKEIIEGYQNKDLTCYFWDKVEKPKAVVQIIHGMQEHAKRYDDFAKHLNKNGFIVFASDLRGHGETAGNVKFLGHTNSDIFKETVSDQILLTEKLKRQYDLPVYIIGFSYGSFIAQRCVQLCKISNKVVLCGSSYTKTPLIWFGKIAAYLTALFKGNHARAKFIEKSSFGNYKKDFENGNWLSSDDEVLKQYLNDPYCGTSFPAGFYKSMFKNMLKNYRDLNMITPEQKIFIISGKQDPVGNYGKLVDKLYNKYKNKKINVELKLYENGRHEIINEVFKDDVYKDIVKFFKEK